VLAPQGVHVAELAVDEKEPAGQGVHAPPDSTLPAGHVQASAAPVSPLDTNPAAHEHVAEPALGAMA